MSSPYYFLLHDPIIAIKVKKKIFTKHIILRPRIWCEAAENTSKIFITEIYRKPNNTKWRIKGKAFNGIKVKDIQYPLDMFLAILGYNPNNCNIIEEQSDFENYILSTQILNINDFFIDEFYELDNECIFSNNTPVTLRYMKDDFSEEKQVLDPVNVTFLYARSIIAEDSKWECTCEFVELNFQNDRGKTYKVTVDQFGRYKNGDVLGMPMPEYFDYIEMTKREE